MDMDDMDMCNCFDLEQHKAIIELNNSAVALLVRGHYGQALETLRDAIHLVSTMNVTNTPNVVTARAEQAQALRKAHTQAICPSKSTFLSSGAGVQVLSSQSSPVVMYKALTSYLNSDALDVAFAVTIDPLSNECYDFSDVFFHIGVVWCNFGIAQTGMAKLYANVYEDMVLREAHYVFQQARAWLNQVDIGGWENLTINMAFRLLSVRTTLTHSLINVSGRLDLEDEYQVYCHDMMRLLHAVEEQQKFLPMNDHLLASAA
jgi:hypothetical protein